ncbi:ABC transporter permease subunit [Candidatus Fermentibacteria bacterium]|nr:ABC transporter permease subunit [Candidatus Fermentibacteria bacterium]
MTSPDRRLGSRGRIARLYLTQLRMVCRDKRTIFVAVLLPLIVVPLILMVNFWVYQKKEEHEKKTEYIYAIQGDQPEKTRQLMRSSTVWAYDEDDVTEMALREVETDSVFQSLADQDIHFIIDVARKSKADTLRPGYPDSLEHPLQSPVPRLTVLYRADHEDGQSGAQRLLSLLEDVRVEHQYYLLRQAGFPANPESTATVRSEDLATSGEKSRSTVGRYATILTLFFVLTGGALVAIDSVAGERERGTLESLLTTAATRMEIVLSKHLLIATVAVAICLIQAANLLFYLSLQILPIPGDIAFYVPPSYAALAFLFLLPVAVLSSGLLLAISAQARSYKEAQLFFLPLFLLMLLPAAAPLAPQLELGSVLLIVPLANVALALKGLMMGQIGWLQASVAWIVTFGAGICATAYASSLLRTGRMLEDVSISRFPGRGPEQFSRRIVPIFSVMWAALFLLSGRFTADIRHQLALNLFLIFLGGSILVVRHYRLPARKAFKLCLPKWHTWPIVLIGASAGIVASAGLFEISSRFLPISEETLRTFAQSINQPSLSTWELLLWVAILPGIIEELPFRGLLVYGLRKKLKPWALIPTVGIIFGLFHITLFRLLPTAFLGMLLTAVVLATGSIFPAMLWHTMNNGLALILTREGLAVEQIGSATFLAALGVLLCCLWLLWRIPQNGQPPDNRAPQPSEDGP